MSNYEVETIQIDEDNRVVVRYDEDGEDPREWGWGIELFEMNYGRGDYYVWLADNPDNDGAVSAFNTFNEAFGSHWPKVRRGMELYMHISEDKRDFDVKVVHVWRDKHNYLVLSDPEDISTPEQLDGFMDTYNRWRNGEVYSVHHERREQWTNADETDTMDTWEEVDSIHGVYLDHEYTALTCAREHFDL